MNRFRRLRSALPLAACLAAMVRPAAGQSLQRLSLQGSGAVLFPTTSDPDFDSKTRLGFEGQLRYTFGRFSVGAGYQRSTVFAFVGNPLTLALSLVFIEPRYVAAAGHGIAFYLAGRLGVGKLICSESGQCTAQKNNLSYGGGTGLLFRLNRRLSLDLGGQYFAVSSGVSSGYAMARAGLGIGL